MKKLNEKEIEDIIANRDRSRPGDEILKSNGILSLWTLGLFFLAGLLNMYFFMIYGQGAFFLFSILTFSVTVLSGLIKLIEYSGPTERVERKYGEHFGETEKKFLFENFEIPLCKTVLGTKIYEFWKETEETDFTPEMRLKAQCMRVKFYLERELPEEIRKYEESEKKRKTAEYKEQRIHEEKQKKKKDRIEKQFQEYMDQYSTELETEKN